MGTSLGRLSKALKAIGAIAGAARSKCVTPENHLELQWTWITECSQSRAVGWGGGESKEFGNTISLTNPCESPSATCTACCY